MDALIVGSTDGLADALARALRRRGMSVLRAIAADASDRERASWLLDEAGRPPLVVVFDAAPYGIAQELLALTSAHVVLVAEQRTAVARAGALRPRPVVPGDQAGLTVVALGRAGRRWFSLGGRRQEPMGPERTAAIVLRACDAAAAAQRS
jgi:hypothetical protein